jgi:thioredoxin
MSLSLPLPPILCALVLAANTPVLAQGPYNPAADVRKNIESALSQARADKKLVLLDFGANWCLDCVVLSKLFEDETVHPFLRDNFHVVSIDVGQWDRNLDVSRQYGSPIDSGIPAVVVLAPDGRIIASTKNGALADARTATAKEILGYLKGWVAQKP